MHDSLQCQLELSASMEDRFSSASAEDLSSPSYFDSSLFTSESTFTPAMVKDPFSQSIRKEIISASHKRCVLCLAYLGDSGHCAHILDSSDSGAEQVKLATKRGILPADYSRSAIENGIYLCPSCHLMHFTPNAVAFSPPRQILEYLLEYIDAEENPMPIHHVLDELVLRPNDLPRSQPIVPFLGIYCLVALKPEKLKKKSLFIENTSSTYQILDGEWTAIPHGGTMNTTKTARIHDTITHFHYGRHPLRYHLDPGSPNKLQHYWRFPTKMAPVLAAFLHRLPFDHGPCEEINLGNDLRYKLSKLPPFTAHHKSSHRSEDSATRRQSHRHRRSNQSPSRNLHTTSLGWQPHVDQLKQWQSSQMRLNPTIPLATTRSGLGCTMAVMSRATLRTANLRQRTASLVAAYSRRVPLMLGQILTAGLGLYTLGTVDSER